MCISAKPIFLNILRHFQIFHDAITVFLSKYDFFIQHCRTIPLRNLHSLLPVHQRFEYLNLLRMAIHRVITAVSGFQHRLLSDMPLGNVLFWTIWLTYIEKTLTRTVAFNVDMCISLDFFVLETCSGTYWIYWKRRFLAFPFTKRWECLS